jgi:hypothetical protein
MTRSSGARFEQLRPKKIAEQARDDVAAGAREVLAHRYHIAVILMAISFGTLALLARRPHSSRSTWS